MQWSSAPARLMMIVSQGTLRYSSHTAFPHAASPRATADRRFGQICFSARDYDLRRPYSVVWSSADWERLYVTSEEGGNILQVFTENGTVASSAAQLANQMMVRALDGLPQVFDCNCLAGDGCKCVPP